MSGWRSNRRDYQDQHGGSSSSSSNYRRPYSHQDHFPPSTSPAGRRKPNKRFGLFGVSTQSDRRKLSIPLKSVSIQANVVDFLAQVEVTQQFVNLEENPIETTYTFPIAPNSAVCGFSAEIEGKRIVAEVKETEEAKDAYDDAISSGHGAYLGQEERAAVFTVTVGNLPPGKEATIRIIYVAELKLLGNKLKKKARKENQPQLLPADDLEQRLYFTLPSRLAPKAKKKQNTYGTVTPTYNRFPEYKLAINVNLKSSGPITGFGSAQPIGMSFLSSNEAKIWLSPLIKALKYDFTLMVGLSEEQKTRSYAIVEEPDSADADYAVVFVVFPRELLATAKPVEKEKEKVEEAKPAAEAKEGEPSKEEKEKEPEKPKGEEPAATEKAEDKQKPKHHLTATGLSWEWPSGVKVQQTPLPVSVHQTSGFLFSYASIPAAALADGSISVVLAGSSTNGQVSLTLNVSNQNAVKGNLVHKLYARAKIRELERTLKDKVEEEKKAEVVALAKRYSLASRYTSFVGVEERTEATEGTMVSRVVPLNAFGYAEQHPRQRGGEGHQHQGHTRGAPRGRGRGFGDAGRRPHAYEERGRSYPDNRGGDRYGSRDDSRDEGRGSQDRREGGGRTRDWPAREEGRGPQDRREGGGRSRDWSAREEGRGPQDRREGGGRGGRDRDFRRQKSLEVSADLVERLVAVKAKNGPYWALTSSISDILGVQLSKLVDGLIGYAVSDYVSTIWATSLVVACVLAHEEATQKHSELVAAAREWLASETERHGFDGTEKWIKKANDYLVAILN